MTCHICGREINQAPACECAYEMERMQASIESLRQTALQFGQFGAAIAKERDELKAENEALAQIIKQQIVWHNRSAAGAVESFTQEHRDYFSRKSKCLSDALRLAQGES